MTMVHVTLTEQEARDLESYLRGANDNYHDRWLVNMADRIAVAIERERMQQDARPG